MQSLSIQLNQLNNAYFYGILDTGYVSPQKWIAKFDGLHQGGAKIIQIRAKGKSEKETRRLLEQVLQRAEEIPAPSRPIIIANRSVELCLKYESVGLHISQDDLSAEAIRDLIGPDRILGLSTHSADQVQKAMNLGPNVLNYFAVGPIFASPTKPAYTPVGLKFAQWVAEQNPPLPFFCIGGINRENTKQVRDTGTKRIVTVSDVLLAQNTQQAVEETLKAIKG